MDAIKMGIGFGLWQQGMPDAHTLFDYIDKAEEWGIDSVWLSDHMMGERAEVSIIPMMAAIAARTQRLKFGPSVLMMPLRHPNAVAREIATLDFLSGGRMIMAVGLGAEGCGGAGKELGLRDDLGVDLQPDDHFPAACPPFDDRHAPAPLDPLQVRPGN